MASKKKVSIDKVVINEVDKVLEKTSYYNAIELLLSMNLLNYADYEAWRKGEIISLCDCLTDKSEEILHILEHAQLYIKYLGMLSEPLSMFQWEQNDIHRSLLFCSSDNPLSQYFHSQFSRSSNIEQMDLFFDSQLSSLITDLKQALISRNIRIASEKLQDLYINAPDDPFYAQAKDLLDALINALEEETLSDPKKEMEFLLYELKPLAQTALAGQERDYMSLFWRRLANHIEINLPESEINSEQMHPSFCFAQIPDWNAVIKSIETHHYDKPDQHLLARIAIARHKTDQYFAYMQSLFDYCWQSFQTMHLPLILVNPAIHNKWQDFLAQNETDDEPDLQSFPTWVLLNEPGLAHHINTSDTTPEIYTLLQALILTETREKKTAINLRKKLKQLHSGTLEYYLEQKKD